jgi:hypothetical protein
MTKSFKSKHTKVSNLIQNFEFYCSTPNLSYQMNLLRKLNESLSDKEDYSSYESESAEEEVSDIPSAPKINDFCVQVLIQNDSKKTLCKKFVSQISQN